MMVSIMLVDVLKDSEPPITDETYEVKFYDHHNTLIKKEEVAFGENATSPLYTLESHTQLFLGWDKTFTDVKNDLDIYPLLADISNENNVIYSSFACSSEDGILTVSFQITGMVNFCCLELEIDYDKACLEYIQATKVDGDGIVNVFEDKIYFVFACSENINGSVDFMTLEFKVIDKNNDNDSILDIFVSDIASFDEENTFIDEKYKVIIGDLILN